MATSKRETRSSGGGGGGGGEGNSTSGGHKRRRDETSTSSESAMQQQQQSPSTQPMMLNSPLANIFSTQVLSLPPSQQPVSPVMLSPRQTQQQDATQLQPTKRIMMMVPPPSTVASPYGTVTPPNYQPAWGSPDDLTKGSLAASVLQAHYQNPYMTHPQSMSLPYTALPTRGSTKVVGHQLKKRDTCAFLICLRALDPPVLDNHLLPFLDSSSLLNMSRACKPLRPCRHRISQAVVYGRRRFHGLMTNISRNMYKCLKRIICHATTGSSTTASMQFQPMTHAEAKMFSALCRQTPSTLNPLESIAFLGHQNLQPESFCLLFDGLGRLPHLRSLDLTGTPMDREGCRALARCISSGNLKLESLILTKCRLPGDGVGSVMSAIRNTASIRDTLLHLDLNRAGEVRPEAIRGMYLPRLKHLNLSSYVLGSHDKRVSDVVVALSEVIMKQNLPSLESLYLNWSSIPDVACQRLAAALALPTSPGLRILEVDVDCLEGKGGWKALCNGLKTGPSRTTLRRLKMCNDLPSENAVRAVGELLLEDGCEVLEELDLHGCSLGDGKLKLLLEVVQQRKEGPVTIKKLDLSQNSLTSKSALALAEAWNNQGNETLSVWQGLEELVLEDNDIDNMGGVHLARAFGQGALPALRVLNLNFNKLSDRALEEMIEALKVDCTHWGLRRVELIGNNIRHPDDLRRMAFLLDPPQDSRPHIGLSHVLAEAFII